MPNAFGNERDGNYLPVVSEKYLPAKLLHWIGPAKSVFTLYSNQIEMMGSYVGSIFALGAVWVSWRSRQRALVYWCAAVWFFGLVIVCKIPGLNDAVMLVPGFFMSRNERFLLVMGMMTTIAGAVGLDALLRAPIAISATPVRLKRLRFATWSLVATSLAAVAAHLVVRFGVKLPEKVVVPALTLTKEIAVAGIGFAGLGVALRTYLQGALSRPKFVMVLGIALILELCHFGLGFNPGFDLAARYPLTPGLEYLQAHTAQDLVVFLDDALPANIATGYRIRDAYSYDALGILSRESALGAAFADDTGKLRKIPSVDEIRPVEAAFGSRIRFLAVHPTSTVAAALRVRYAANLAYQGPDLIIADLSSRAD